MKWLLALSLAVGMAARADAQQAPPSDEGVRSPEEIPADMPPPPDSAPPAEAPPVGATDERPPHPQTPDPLAEAQPSAEVLASTSYHWLPGHWIWTGQQFEWLTGRWIYKVKDMILVPPRWEWNGQQWVFHNAGWARPGTYDVVYRPTDAPGGPDAIGNPAVPPGTYVEAPPPQQSVTTVYVWTGFYVPPPIFFPIWSPWYHYYWFHRHPLYVRPPLYLSPRYRYARMHPPPPRYRPPPAARPPQRPGTRPTQPSTRPGTRPSQPSTRPSTRPSQPSTRPSQPSTRPSTRPSAPSTRPSTRPSGPSTRPSGGGSRGGRR